MMKRTLYLLIAVCMEVTLFVACGIAPAPDMKADTTQSAEKKDAAQDTAKKDTEKENLEKSLELSSATLGSYIALCSFYFIHVKGIVPILSQVIDC